LEGRRGSLDALIREHSYSTDTVRNIFKASSRSGGGNGLSPGGALADFFLVHGENEAHAALHPTHGDGTAMNGAPSSVEGAVALKDCVRVLNGFGSSLEGMLPKLRDGFIRNDTPTDRRLASEHPRGFFLSPSGEAFHNATVTGGRVRAQGPLALKRELSDVREKLNATETALAQAE